MKWRIWFVPFLILVIILSTGCGTTGKLSIANGTKDMETILMTMKNNITSQDAAAVNQGAKQLEEKWSSFEEDVKKKSPSLYEKVEGPLDTIRAGAKESPLDEKTLVKFIDQLQSILIEVQKL